MFVTFEGIDGSGKTTTAAILADLLRARGRSVALINKKDVDFGTTFANEHLAKIRDLLWNYDEATPVTEIGDEHWFHLMLSWFSALDRHRVRPAILAYDYVIVDNWYYKLLARLKLKVELDYGFWDLAFSRFSSPDFVFFLSISPDKASSRRTTFAPGESGLFDGRKGANQESFISYQTEVGRLLKAEAVKRRWPRLDTSSGAIQVAEEAAAYLRSSELYSNA